MVPSQTIYDIFQAFLYRESEEHPFVVRFSFNDDKPYPYAFNLQLARSCRAVPVQCACYAMRAVFNLGIAQR